MTKPNKQIKRVYIVYKKSVYQKFVLDLKNKHLSDLLKKKHPSTSRLLHNHTQHLKAIKKLEEALVKHGISYKISARSNLQSFKNYDLIITVGGDGTILRASQNIHNQMIMGINSVPSASVGALCSIKVNEVKSAIERLAIGDFKIKELPRIRIKINGKNLDHEPINDVLFTNISPAGTSRYLIQHNRKKEEHKSSGMWISTPIGSTAAILAAGGKKQSPSDTRLQFLTREPYEGIQQKYSITKGFVPHNKQLTVVSKMIDSRLYLDGPTSFKSLEYGDKVSFSVSSNHLKMIVL